MAKHETMNFDALQSSVDVINATNAVALNVTKFAVKSGSILEHCEFRVTFSNRAFFYNTTNCVCNTETSALDLNV